MTLAHEIEQTWQLLAMLEHGQEGMEVRELDGVETPNGPLLFATGSGGERHMLIPVPPRTPIDEDRVSSGVQVLAHRLLDRGSTRWFVDVVCRKPHLHELFTIILVEIVEALARDPARPDRVAARVLAAWRELLAREQSRMPGTDVLAGLFGELLELREFAGLSPHAVLSWAGPLGARHDFSVPGLALEVKTTRSRGARTFEINGLDQLDVPAGGELYLATFRLEESTGEGESLRDVVGEVLGLGVDAHALVTMLDRAGIAPDQLEALRGIRFRVVDEFVHRVDAAFPKLTRAALVGGALPPGVLSVRYQIEVEGDRPAALDTDAVRALRELFVEGIRS